MFSTLTTTCFLAQLALLLKKTVHEMEDQVIHNAAADKLTLSSSTMQTTSNVAKVPSSTMAIFATKFRFFPEVHDLCLITNKTGLL